VKAFGEADAMLRKQNQTSGCCLTFDLRRFGPSLLERQPKSRFKLKKSRVFFIINGLCQRVIEYAIDVQQIS
jgi:hypothetical protein